MVFRPPVGAIPRLGTVLPVQGPGVGNAAMMSSAYVGSVHHSSRPLGTSTGRPALLPIAPRPRQIDQASDPFKEHIMSMGQTQEPPPMRSERRGIYTVPQRRQLGAAEHDSSFQNTESAAPVLNAQFTTSHSTYDSEGYAYAGNNAWQQTNQYIPDVSPLDYNSQIPSQQSVSFTTPNY